MKLVCDLCGGALQMNSGGQGATCTGCGLTYSMERLREKLGHSQQAVSPAEPNKQLPKVTQESFRMTAVSVFHIAGRGIAVSGTIESGSVRVGGEVSVNGGKTGKVDLISIHGSGKFQEQAEAGSSVNLLLKEIKITDVAVGDVLTCAAKTASEPADDPKPAPAPAFVPQQFVMDNSGASGGLSGRVRQGGIGLGDNVYINGDYTHPYRVHRINDDPYMSCAKEGMPTALSLLDCPKKVLKNARQVTGDPHPAASAYNYPGTVREYFLSLFSQEFPEYTVQEDVFLSRLTIPVTFLLCRDEQPVMAVFLIGSNDGKTRTQAKRAAGFFAPVGIACTHFYENYRNDTPYVMKRLRGALGDRPN